MIDVLKIALLGFLFFVCVIVIIFIMGESSSGYKSKLTRNFTAFVFIAFAIEQVVLFLDVIKG